SREQRERLERGYRVTALERIKRHIEDGQMIGHEEGVEFAAFKRLREAFEMREIEIGIRESAGITPGAGVDGGRPHEGAEPQLTRCRHRQPPSRKMLVYRRDFILRK